jgi:hypothetical protein
MNYDTRTNQFFYNWKLGTATGLESITAAVAYPSTTAKTSKSELITITRLP